MTRWKADRFLVECLLKSPQSGMICPCVGERLFYSMARDVILGRAGAPVLARQRARHVTLPGPEGMISVH